MIDTEQKAERYLRERYPDAGTWRVRIRLALDQGGRVTSWVRWEITLDRRDGEARVTFTTGPVDRNTMHVAALRPTIAEILDRHALRMRA
jgi:hypothetical protein